MDSLTRRFHNEVFGPYVQFLKAKYRIHPNFSHAKQQWESKLTAGELINGPYLEQSQVYDTGDDVADLLLHEKTRATVAARLGGRKLWKHQSTAIRLILGARNAVVATGTSSGKTLCYQIPILDDLIRNPESGLRAVIVYPLNALVNDQLTEWEYLLARHPEIKFARFTGQTPSSQEEYVALLQDSYRAELADQGLKQQEVQRRVQDKLKQKLAADPINRLNHRDAIRKQPPHILITNFSMLEYLLERPVDAPVFQKSRLKFLVLDEAHAYRGVQATEIAFLIRRIKDRLGLTGLTCIATSATLGKEGDESSREKVRKFAGDLFGESFDIENPITGTLATVSPPRDPITLAPEKYKDAAERIRNNITNPSLPTLGADSGQTILELLQRDVNFYRLRTEILKRPILLTEAAERLWPGLTGNAEALEAMLELVGSVKDKRSNQDLLPTRLHYFVRAQDGLHVCLHLTCPGRSEGRATFFVTRSNNPDIPEGLCPYCFQAGQQSRLVEVVTCRKCGYLYGALQDLGPKRAQAPENDQNAPPYFDSFTTELGWMADSYWSYFSVEGDLPFPNRVEDAEDEENEDEDDVPSQSDMRQWCVGCGKKNDKGAGDNCKCEKPHLRTIRIFHRQCPYSGKAKDAGNLYRQEKSLLTRCRNCNARNGSGLEPLQRFQESYDSMGLAMAVPLAHFQVSPREGGVTPVRKLLCFTDHRQRAAAFPSLLEEETFALDMGRKIVQIVKSLPKSVDLISLGESLADFADRNSDHHDTNLFLPVSRFPDEDVDAKGVRNLWLSEVFAYFGVPDSARDSAEDFGLVTVEYELTDADKTAIHAAIGISTLSVDNAADLVQVLLGFLRQRKAFTLPKGRVDVAAPAFGRITADVAYVREFSGVRNTNGWLPKGQRDNVVTNYLARALKITGVDARAVADRLWECLTGRRLLLENKDRWKLDHEKILIRTATSRYVCGRCGLVSSYSVGTACTRKHCEGVLLNEPFDASRESIIAKWVAGLGSPHFYTLKSEEHTAQINKDLAKSIEDAFRAEGINLLSSTTTFEMGINIGDLQKVLLRNAPPSSASYVQRIGRTGRGNDKNAVCVTLCSRSKYDADTWMDPPRLMSGEVRTPTVFTANRVIAQRHFNAVLFAQFLRDKLLDNEALGELRQKIRLEAFLPLESRAGVPEAWSKLRPVDIYLDFVSWLSHSVEHELFRTDSGQSLVSALGNFATASQNASSRYTNSLGAIAEELSALKKERSKAYELGHERSDIDQAIKNLLAADVIATLAKRGFLPRYAFPLDVVTLETGQTRWSRVSDVELSRDRGIAIAEFAPGAQVIAHKKVYTSAGIYVVSKMDKPIREWYSECPSCKQIRTAQTKDGLKGPCLVCQRQITDQCIRPFVSPLAFSVRVDDKRPSERYRRNSFIRQRQTVTHFIDQVDEASFNRVGAFDLALKDSGRLFRYNLGPEHKGFMLCDTCGCSEPLRTYKPGKKHLRLRAISNAAQCQNEHPWATLPLAYGHQFQSFCLVIRPVLAPGSVSSLAYALQKGLCQMLEIEPADIGVSWRWLSKDQEKSRTEIVLYDQTPGGAGFVKEGYEGWTSVARFAEHLCRQCKCEHACYDCLKSYSNQTYHDELDRTSVASFFDDSSKDAERLTHQG